MLFKHVQTICLQNTGVPHFWSHPVPGKRMQVLVASTLICVFNRKLRFRPKVSHGKICWLNVTIACLSKCVCNQMFRHPNHGYKGKYGVNCFEICFWLIFVRISVDCVCCSWGFGSAKISYIFLWFDRIVWFCCIYVLMFWNKRPTYSACFAATPYTSWRKRTNTQFCTTWSLCSQVPNRLWCCQPVTTNYQIGNRCFSNFDLPIKMCRKINNRIAQMPLIILCEWAAHLHGKLNGPWNIICLHGAFHPMDVLSLRVYSIIQFGGT